MSKAASLQEAVIIETRFNPGSVRKMKSYVPQMNLGVAHRCVPSDAIVSSQE